MVMPRFCISERPLFKAILTVADKATRIARTLRPSFNWVPVAARIVDRREGPLQVGQADNRTTVESGVDGSCDSFMLAVKSPKSRYR